MKPTEISRSEYTEEMAREAREKAKTAGDKIGTSINDAWIHTKITSKLISDKDTPARKINIDVVDGVVTLRGEVNTTTAKDEADRIAKEHGRRQASEESAESHRRLKRTFQEHTRLIHARVRRNFFGVPGIFCTTLQIWQTLHNQ